MGETNVVRLLLGFPFITAMGLARSRQMSRGHQKHQIGRLQGCVSPWSGPALG